MEDVQKQLRRMFIVRKGSFMEIDLQRVKRVGVVAAPNKKQDSRSHKKLVDIIKKSPKENIEDIITNLNCPECNSKNLLLFENTQKRKRACLIFTSKMF